MPEQVTCSFNGSNMLSLLGFNQCKLLSLMAISRSERCVNKVVIDIKTLTCLIQIFKKLMQIPPIAYSLDYQMSE